MLLFELMLGVILMLLAGMILALIIELMGDIKNATSNKLRRWIFGKDKDG